MHSSESVFLKRIHAFLGECILEILRAVPAFDDEKRIAVCNY